MDPAYVGRSFTFAHSYEVGRENIRVFAEAIGDDNPMYHDRVAAQSAGHPDVVAPPTFVYGVNARAQDQLMFDPELGLDYTRVVHGDQRFEYRRPIYAGDVLTSTVHIDSIRQLAGNDVISVHTDVHDSDGDLVVVSYGSLVSRAAG